MLRRHPLGGVFGYFTLWRNARLVEQAASQIVDQCRDDLWQRMRQPAATMSPPEIRGYVRALAMGVVCEQLSRENQLKPALRGRVAEAAVDQLIGLVVHGALSGALPAKPATMAA
ncbi:MAG: hypothetical protein LLF97_03520 [Planctomycetaceae bacterium]|nr:hypothetical protein [Planctomycetaceae bacterium]